MVGTALRIYTGYVQAFTGYSDQSYQTGLQGIRIARENNHAFSIAWGLLGLGRLDVLLGRYAQAIKHTEEALRVCEEMGFVDRSAEATIIRGVALANHDSPDTGLEDMCRGWETYLVTGGNVYYAWNLALIANTHLSIVQLDKATERLQEADRIHEQSEERMFYSEILRLWGVVAEKRKDVQTAEDRYQAALALSEKQGARLLELRAAVNLSRLWQRQDRSAEATALLQPLYDWFTEGFDTPDLIGAKALLDELS